MALSEKLAGQSAVTELVAKINAKFAPLASPALTGTPTAPTATTGTNTTQIATTAFVQQEINGITSAYVPKGSAASVAALPALTTVTVGWVYNLEAAGETTADFLEGAGKKIPAGANIACVLNSDDEKKWDVLSGFVDLTDYQTKALAATTQGADTVEAALTALANEKVDTDDVVFMTAAEVDTLFE